MKVVNLTMIQKDKKMFSFIPIIRAKFASDKSFTLIELLIVIGILAILVAAIVVVLNPAQLLAQARDGKRQQDLSALNQSLNTIYALDQSVSFGTSSIVYTSLPDTSTSCASWFPSSSLPVGWQYHCSPTTTLQNTDGTGWIPVNFKTTGVVSLASLPIDPINTSSTGLYYTYVSGGSFELTAAFESTKYKLGGDKDIASTDGGSYPDLYEVGSNLALQPMDHGDPSLVGYWPLNEGTGTIAYDRSGKGNNGTLVNGPTWTSGKVGGALSFSGANFVSVLDSASIKPNYITMTAWVNPNAWAAIPYILSKGDGSQNGSGYNFAFNNTTPDTLKIYGWVYRTSDGAPLMQSGLTSIASSSWGLWYFVTLTYDGTKLLGYLNGALNTSILSSNSDLLKNKAVNLAIGPNFLGSIDDVRVYNRALSASEISALYNATR